MTSHKYIPVLEARNNPPTKPMTTYVRYGTDTNLGTVSKKDIDTYCLNIKVVCTVHMFGTSIVSIS